MAVSTARLQIPWVRDGGPVPGALGLPVTGRGYQCQKHQCWAQGLMADAWSLSVEGEGGREGGHMAGQSPAMLVLKEAQCRPWDYVCKQS